MFSLIVLLYFRCFCFWFYLFIDCALVWFGLVVCCVCCLACFGVVQAVLCADLDLLTYVVINLLLLFGLLFYLDLYLFKFGVFRLGVVVVWF